MISSNKLLNPLRFYTVDERNEIDLLIKSNQQTKAAWLEKFRRFSCFYGRKLGSISKVRFGSKYQDQIRWMKEWLIVETEAKHIIDHSFLSAVLYCNDTLGINYDDRISHLLSRLESDLIKIEEFKEKDLKLLGKIDDLNISIYKNNALKPRSVIFSPTSSSHHALILIDQLIKLKSKPELIIIRRITLSRFFSELKRDGFVRILKKVWRKLVLNASENNSPGSYGTLEVLKDLCISTFNLRRISKLYGIPIINVAEFEEANDLLHAINADYGLFAGGGLISDSTIRCFKHGLINTHLGPLPYYRGMDVIEAPILNGDFHLVSVTAHFMSAGLDTGPVISRFTTNSDFYEYFASLGNEMRAVQPILAISSMFSNFNANSSPVAQHLADGKQFYYIHPSLRSVLNRVLLYRFHNKFNHGDMVGKYLSNILIKSN